MKLTRREMILAGLGLMVGGCAGPSTPGHHRPRTQWPNDTSAPRPSHGTSVGAEVPAPPPPRPSRQIAGLDAIPRGQWASRGVVAGRVNPMGPIDRITVHHEGWTVVSFSDYHRTAQRIEQDRRVHVDDRGWGDIGYHYIVDRAGRLWEGRSLAYQGAHVGGYNEHNIGVMCLGNFDKQRPTEVQIQALADTLVTLRRQYHIPVSRIYTHQELSPSACPGTFLQPRLASMRRSGQLT